MRRAEEATITTRSLTDEVRHDARLTRESINHDGHR